MSKENINYMEKVPYFKEDIISILYSAAEITDREELYDSYMSAAHDIISNNIKKFIYRNKILNRKYILRLINKR